LLTNSQLSWIKVPLHWNIPIISTVPFSDNPVSRQKAGKMRPFENPGRIAGLWYLLLIILGPLRLIYIPSKLIVSGNAPATVSNIVDHEFLFRLGIVADLVGAIVLVLLSLALYRLFQGVDRNLAAQVVIFGGVMPALLYFVGITADFGALMIAHGANFLAAFDKPQQDALAMLLLKLRSYENTAAETLWGVWLFPLALLVYRSRFMPRFIAVWLALNGVAWAALSFTGALHPQSLDLVDKISQPATFGEIIFMLWLVVKGVKVPATNASAPRDRE
jgi:hypothetical protein